MFLQPFYKMFGSGEEGIKMEAPNKIILFDNKDSSSNFYLKKMKKLIFYRKKEIDQLKMKIKLIFYKNTII